MDIIPTEIIKNIPTGNRYKGRDGLVDLGLGNSIIDVADFFPFHKVDMVGRLHNKGIRSHVLGGQVRVYYGDGNNIREIEVLTSSDITTELEENEVNLKV